MKEDLSVKPVVVEKKLYNFVPGNLLWCSSSFWVPFFVLMSLDIPARLMISLWIYLIDLRISSIQDFEKYKQDILNKRVDDLQKEVDALKPKEGKILKG